MKHVRLSISIVSYNNFKDVCKAIETIEKYTNAKLTKVIYIIDNADERHLYEDFVKQYNDVEYIYTGKNLGFGKGHNYVLDRLNSDYHAYVNPDILLREDSFSKIIEYMEKNNVHAVAPRLVDQNGKFQNVYRRDVTVADMFIRMFARGLFPKRVAYHELSDHDFTKPFQVPFAQGSFLVLDTSLVKQLKGFDDRYFMYMEDADLCKRINRITPLMYYPYTTVIHKWEKGSHRNKKLFKIHVQSMIAYMNKWGWKLH